MRVLVWELNFCPLHLNNALLRLNLCAPLLQVSDLFFGCTMPTNFLPHNLRRPIGNTGISVSPLGFGASPLGNEFGVIDVCFLSTSYIRTLSISLLTDNSTILMYRNREVLMPFTMPSRWASIISMYHHITVAVVPNLY